MNTFKKEVLNLKMLFPIFFIIIGFCFLLSNNSVDELMIKIFSFKASFSSITSTLLFVLMIPRIGFTANSTLPSIYQSRIIWIVMTPLLLILALIVV